MSWKGFKKAVSRMPASIGIGMGGIQQTKDEEYEVYEQQFQQLHGLAKRLWEDSKKFKDSLQMMLVHQSDMASCFVDVFAAVDEVTIATNFAAAMKNAKESLSDDLQQIERLVVQPTGDYITILEQVKVYMVKRSHKLLDYDRHRAAVEKLKQKPNRTVADEKTLGQYENNLDQATREFNNINNQLKQELPILLNLRLEFIDPCLLAFYNYQVKVFHTLYGIFYQTANDHFDLSTTASASYETKEAAVNALLTQLNVPKRLQSPEPNAGPAVLPPPNLATSEAVSRTGTFSSMPINPVRPAGPQYVVALYDFLAQAPGDLSFRKGDKIELVERKENVNDWWVGKFNGEVGQFPGNLTYLGNYVQDLK